MLPFRACRYPAEGQAQGDGDRRGMEVRLCCVAQRRAGRQAILGDGAGHLDQHQGRLEVPLQGCDKAAVRARVGARKCHFRGLRHPPAMKISPLARLPAALQEQKERGFYI